MDEFANGPANSQSLSRRPGKTVEETFTQKQLRLSRAQAKLARAQSSMDKLRNRIRRHGNYEPDSLLYLSDGADNDLIAEIMGYLTVEEIVRSEMVCRLMRDSAGVVWEERRRGCGSMEGRRSNSVNANMQFTRREGSDSREAVIRNHLAATFDVEEFDDDVMDADDIYAPGWQERHAVQSAVVLNEEYPQSFHDADESQQNKAPSFRIRYAKHMELTSILLFVLGSILYLVCSIHDYEWNTTLLELPEWLRDADDDALWMRYRLEEEYGDVGSMVPPGGGVRRRLMAKLRLQEQFELKKQVYNKRYHKVLNMQNSSKLPQKRNVQSTPEELYYNLVWQDLPPEIQDAYGILGYNQVAWDTGQAVLVDSMGWDELSPEMQQAALFIGYTEGIWCGFDDLLVVGTDSPTQFPIPIPNAKPTTRPIIPPFSSLTVSPSTKFSSSLQPTRTTIFSSAPSSPSIAPSKSFDPTISNSPTNSPVSTNKTAIAASVTDTSEEVDFQKCYYDLLAAASYQPYLSQEGFTKFIQLFSDGQVGFVTQWGGNITSFSMLQPELVGIYNLYACGDALTGCPSIEGIDIGVNGVNLQSGGVDSLLNRICGDAHAVIGKVVVGTDPTVGSGGNETTMSPGDVDSSSPSLEPSSSVSAEPSFHAPGLPSFSPSLMSSLPSQAPSQSNLTTTNPTSLILAMNPTAPAPDEIYFDEWWRDLPLEIQEAYAELGWNETIWDQGGEPPASDSMRWDELSMEEQDAAGVLGYTQYSWDATIQTRDPSETGVDLNNTPLNTDSAELGNETLDPDTDHYEHYDWAELPPEVKAAAEILGYNQDLWDSSGIAWSVDMYWSELSPEAQAAAAVIGYNEASWNSGGDPELEALLIAAGGEYTSNDDDYLFQVGENDVWVSEYQVLYFFAALCFVLVGVIDLVQEKAVFHFVMILAGLFGVISAVFVDENIRISNIMNCASVHLYVLEGAALLLQTSKRDLADKETWYKKLIILADLEFLLGAILDVILSYFYLFDETSDWNTGLQTTWVFSAVLWVHCSLIYLGIFVYDTLEERKEARRGLNIAPTEPSVRPPSGSGSSSGSASPSEEEV